MHKFKLKREAEALVQKMTLREKASLCSGRGYWHTKAIKRLGLPAAVLSDGPHGLRRQGRFGNTFGIGGSKPATCFPTASALACSFDPELLYEIGVALAEEAIVQDVTLVLGPGVNIKRSPLGGRNFEYFSEDTELSGKLGAAFTHGVQSLGIGACVKHFAANSQERNRMVSDSIVDEDVLRETYFPAFERIIREENPVAVMCSYNKVNGTYASENRWLLTDVLRDEWGYDGLVVSDWGATADRVRGLEAGLDLEMPGTGSYNTRKIVKAVKSGALDESFLDAAAVRVTAFALEAARSRATAGSDKTAAEISEMYESHHALARRAAARSAVLLKNERALPIQPGAKVAVIGEFAKKPRYQGAGSSFVHPTRIDSAWDELAANFPDATYAPGYDLAADSTTFNTRDTSQRAPIHACGRYTVYSDDSQSNLSNIPTSSAIESEDGRNGGATAQQSGQTLNLSKNARFLIDDAVATACAADVAVVFAGLPPEYESEGYDRESLFMPPTHDELIRAVCAVNKNTVVIIQAGAPVDLSSAQGAAAIVYAYLGGQAGGSAIADILTGKTEPSGRLAETFPLHIEDTPCYGNFSIPSGAYPLEHTLRGIPSGAQAGKQSDSREVYYAEGSLVGYKHYEAKGIPVAYPFGYGLRYDGSQIGSNGNIRAESSEKGNSNINPRSTPTERKSADTSHTESANHSSAAPPYDANSTLSDMRGTPIGFILSALVRLVLTFIYGTGAYGRRMVSAIVDETPMRTLASMSGGLLPRELIQCIINLANIGK